MEKLKGPNEPSGPELQMKAILDSLGLSYEYEFPVRSGFILDFAFLDKRKGIEVDGYYHQFNRERDRFRDMILRRGGWGILRIEADDLSDPDNVKGRIRAFLGVG